MIDTIVLTLNHNHFAILDHNKFSPSTVGLFEPPYYKLGNRSNFKCVQNPTKSDLKKGIYKPRLTVMKRFQAGAFVVILKIEFSIPKLLFGNNFDEVEENQLKEIIQKLYEALNTMGVLVFPQILHDAPVSTIHYSKNIPLTDYSTPSLILQEISKINLNQILDLNQTDFRNGGYSLKFHANSFEVSLYDKRKDLEKAKLSEKRALEKDNSIQLELLNQWKPKNPFEVLRMEIRLNQRSKIRQIFKKNNISTLLTFTSVFKKDTAQKVLLHYLEQIKKAYTLLAYHPQNGQEFINNFKTNNSKTKIRKMLQVYASIKLIDELGIRKFQESIKIFGQHNWPRIKKDLETLHFPNKSFEPLKTLEYYLKKFEPLRLKNYSESNG